MTVPIASSGLVLLGLNLCGCSTIRGFPSPPKTAIVDSPDVDWELGPKAIATYNAAETDSTKQKQIRNEIIDARVAAIDPAYGDYERAIYKESVEAGFGGGLLVSRLPDGASQSLRAAPLWPAIPRRNYPVRSSRRQLYDRRRDNSDLPRAGDSAIDFKNRRTPINDWHRPKP